MRLFDPELAHIRGLGNEGFHGVLAARLAGIPRILVSVHGSVGDLINGPRTLRRRIVALVLEPLTLLLATHVVTVCEDALLKPILRPVRRKVLGVVPNGVDLTTSSPIERLLTRQALAIGAEDLVLIIVARLSLDKGHIDLLSALDALPRNWEVQKHLLVVGDGPDSDLIAQKARSVGGTQIHMLGRRHDVSRLLHASDIAVLPSLHENMSNALLEAMAAGVAVVASSVGGNTEVITKGGGILVPPSNPSALAAAIEMLLGNASQRSVLGQEARGVIEAGYTTQHMKSRLAEVYTQILKG